MQQVLLSSTGGMKTPIYVRPLTSPESRQLAVARRASHAFRVRRLRWYWPAPWAAPAGTATPSPTRRLLRADRPPRHPCLHQGRRRRLGEPANRPKQYQAHVGHGSVRAAAPPAASVPADRWPAHRGVDARAGGPRQPRTRSDGTTLSDETVRRALKRLGAPGKRATHWITSPDPP